MSDTPSPREHAKAVAFLLCAAVLWSLGGLLIKLVNWHPLAIAAARSLFAIPIVMIWSGPPRWPVSVPQFAGALAYVATVGLFVASTRMTTAANAIFLQYTAPIYVALLAPLVLNEPSRRSDWAAIGVALLGMGMFFADGLSPEGLKGNILAILSGGTFAAMTLFLRKERKGAPMQVVLLGNILTVILGAPFAFLAGPPEPKAWVALVILGIVQLGFSYVLYAVAIRRVKAVEATLITLLEPILNPIWVMLAVGERPGGWALCGAALVVLSVLIRGVLGALRK